MDKVSVIIPTYNRRQLVVRALESVWAQDYKNLEVIVVDDGSCDGTEQTLSPFLQEKRLLTYLKQTQKGVSAARNAGIKLAKGEFIAFLDSDDEWEKTKITRQMLYLEQNPHLSIVHTDEIWIRHGVRVNPHKKHQKSGGHIFERSLGLCLISPSSVLMRKELLDEVGLFREDFLACEDYDLWLKITSGYEVGYIDRPLAIKYGGHPDQLSKKFHSMDYWRVLSIDWLLQNGELSATQRQCALKTLREKLAILENGYRKRKQAQKLSWAKNVRDEYSLS